MHSANHLLDLFYLFSAAQVFGWLFRLINQPMVLGQMLAGLIVGPSVLGLVHDGEVLGFIAELGAVFLLFLVGMEIRLQDILSVGREAILVAVTGVAMPFAGGYLISTLAGFDHLPSLFISTALIATSVGITAAVLRELQVLSRDYTRIILGAAVIDDILSLILLSVVTGMAEEGAVDSASIARLTGLSLLFVFGTMALVTVMRRLPLDRLPFRSPVGFALALGVGLAALSAAIGLAPIIGAFLAGMLIADIQEDYELGHAIHSVESFLAPIFFGMVGVKLELGILTESATLQVGLILSIVGIATKALAGGGAFTQGWRNAAVVGIGMTPRGEVALIVAAVGLSVGAFAQKEYALILMMVVTTTLLAPLMLRPLITRAEQE